MQENRAKTHIALAPELLHRLRQSLQAPLPLRRALFQSLFALIRDGVLAEHSQLPPSRQLAQALGIGRNTVIAVYQQLQDLGMLHTDGRRGSRVCFRSLPDTGQRMTTRPPPLAQRASSARLSHSGTRLPFTPGEPDVTLLPQRQWQRALNHAARQGRQRYGYTHDSGDPALREQIARFLGSHRGMRVEPERILLTQSTRQSLLLCAHLFADAGDTAWAEHPGYQGALDAWRSAGLAVHPCDVDAQGACPPEHAPPAKLIYLTPCVQFPLGHSLSAARRQQWLQLAQRQQAVIFEDDYDSEFRHQDASTPAMAADPQADAHVIYAGTFSKLLFPGARCAWLVLPDAYIQPACALLRALGGGHPGLMPAALACLLADGSLIRHLQRARQLYSQRRLALTRALARHLPSWHIRPHTGGLNLLVDMARAYPAAALSAALQQAGIGARPLTGFAWSEPEAQASTLVFGLGNVDSMHTDAVIQNLAQALTAFRGESACRCPDR